MWGPIFECGAVCWERCLGVEPWVGTAHECGAVYFYQYLSVEQWVGADIWVLSGVLGLIFKCGRCVGTKSCVWSVVLVPIFVCESVCWDRYLSLERCVETNI